MAEKPVAPLIYGIPVPALFHASRPRAEDFVAELARRAQLTLVLATPQSYDALAAMVDLHKIDLAWLPPIPFIGLERAKLAVPLVAHDRGGPTGYHSVMVARRDANIGSLEALIGKRAAWVDPLSASGYVLPRIELDAQGIDPRLIFGSQRFYRSHEECVRAVLDGHADVTCTFARVDGRGNVTRGSWAGIDGADKALRMVAVFGAVPPDNTAARADVPADVRARLTSSLLAMSSDAGTAPLVHEVFGVDRFKNWEPVDYEGLRVSMVDAAGRGLLDASDTTGQFPTMG